MLPAGPRFRRHVTENAQTVMRDKTRILFSLSQLTPLTPALSPRSGRGREIFVTFTQGSASLALGYFLTPLNGAL